MLYTDDFTYYYFGNSGNTLESAPSAGKVPTEIDDFCTIGDAVRYVQKLGCVGQSQHHVRTEFHRLALEVLKLAVDLYGQEFASLLRGVRSDRSDSEHRILFGTTNPDVAAFYGNIRTYKNVRGLRTVSYAAASVVTGDLIESDEEIIFFPGA